MKYTDFESLTLLFTIFQLYCAEHICGWKQEWPGKEKNRLSSKSQWQSDVRKVWRYQRGYQKDRQHYCHRKIPKWLSEGQTTQLPQKDTKEVIRRTDNTIATERYQRGYQKDRQHNCHRKIPRRLSEGQTTQVPKEKGPNGLVLWCLMPLSPIS